MKLGRKYLERLENAGKIRRVISLAAKDAVSCSVCGHGARRHYPGVPGWESWPTSQLVKWCASVVPMGSRRYCPGMACRGCEGERLNAV